ncbi:tail length tape measure protein [Phormidesmis priestleyi ULC007]|uniref:Tail length tape measure protein n=1 Tax=Phormidesmis priestleyi ULC007 TaxID=1920490 RepID=A0A2T1D955_9CYAN|nr:transglycosylase SLT domain-containing protein [Phormidesmis priestleyi]PSB16983.1 tail length tape measure protein [Phormidesmis priestleyi ULC007]PZO47908.1 MAG: tail length tape measure protein [Phormidesmis priestleyi]
MLKQRKIWIVLAAGTGLSALLIGTFLPIEKLKDASHQAIGLGSNSTKPESVGSPSTIVSPLIAQSPNQRAATLKATAQKSTVSLERNRARYLLASDLIAQGQGDKAIESLKGLEKDYPVLSAQVLLKRAQAYEVAGKQSETTATWQELVKQYPNDPAAAEALFFLGKSNPKYWDQAIEKFPAHPRSVEIAQLRLKKNPNQLALLMLIVNHATNSEGYTGVLNKITEKFAPQLQPKDWEAIAFGYWENQVYDKGAFAYARAPQTAVNAYRAARGLHLSGKPGGEDRYRQVVQQFPNSPEAGLALTRLAALAEQPQLAIAYLDQVIQHFPDRAPAALVEKSKQLDKLNSSKFATQVRQLVLTQYANTDAAAEMRWAYAQERAKAGDFRLAKQWAEPILNNNPDSEIAAQAGFWVGKWTEKLGKSDEAKAIYQKVLAQHSDSYYAWRSASRLGWNVGDFNSVRSLNPAVNKPATRPELVSGSPVLKELYQLGQDRDAWTHWQIEFQGRMAPTMAEQFTDGVMRLGVGDNLDGIFMVSNLSDRDKPEEKEQYRSLKQQSAYWQALYPFPYLQEIENWSQQQQLNPLLVTALIRQESRFESKIKSSVGATGLMQVMPDTATFIASNIKLKQFKLDDPNDNIRLGTWYLDHTHLEYNNNSMLAVASYNAGPGAVGGWLSKAKTQDTDEFVEMIPYDETKGYVKSVFGNYWNYLRLYNPEISKQISKVSSEHPKDS